MSNQKLFLWEFLISKIKFDPGAISVPSYDSMRIVFLCSYILGTEILTDECPVDDINPDEKPNNGEFNVRIGKTSLFSANPDDLTTELQQKSLIIDLYLSTKKAGSASFKWPPAFPDFVKTAATGSKSVSVVHLGSFDFVDSGGKKIASINMGIKLVFLGENVETAFSLKFKDAIFINPKTNTKFKSEKAVTIDVVPSSLPLQSESRISWIGLFERKMAAEAMSIPPFNIDEMEMRYKGKAPDATSRLSQYWDVVSIKFRPDDNRFMDIMNLMADEAALDPSKAKKETKFADTVGVHKHEEEADNELTSEKIMKKICNNPACPAAKKFKEYGLGPLATGPGLGTMYKKVQPTKTYRLSNTYGVFTRYGPFGVFEKSIYPFFPPKEDTTEVCPLDFPCLPDEDEEVCSCYSDQEPSEQESKCSCGVRYCRLRGGEEKKVIQEKFKKCSCCKHRHHQDNDVPLRLRGGGIAEEDGIDSVSEFTVYTICDLDNKYTTWPTSYDCDNNNAACPTSYDCDQYSARLRGGGKKNDKKKDEEEKPNAMKSPMEECKSVMDLFNQILVDYKKALGPCGEASCPFSQNICGEYCKKICHAKEEPCPCMRKDSCQEMPCDIDECPFKKKQDKKIKGSCGSPHCPYAQYKLGLVTDDAELELAYLPPAVMGKCGDPKCDYPPQFLTLPPIHWDCPDPLPQGCCKNPNCPHQPKGLQELKVPVPKAPCGSAACPYALPPACDMPSCPFREKPCPFKAQKKAGVAKPSCASDSDESDDEGACCNPDCPYSSNKNGGNKRLRAGSEAGSAGCSNPCCPSKKKNPACCCNQESDTEESFCDSPECPLNRRKVKGTGCFPPPQEPKSDVCENPECPSRVYKRHKKDDDEIICDNDDCPYRKGMGNRDDDDVCGNPYCPYNDPPPKKNACANPKCPFSGSGHAEESDNASICSSPDCPFTQSRKKKKNDDVCGNPNCPYKPKLPKASGEVCNDCTDLLCNNPDCPNYSPPPISSNPDYCDNPMCPFSKEYQTAVCVDPFCPYAQPLPSCGIPNCPYEKKPIMFCPSPICPSKFATAIPQETSGPASSAPASGGDKDKKAQRRRSSEEQKKKVDGSGDAGQRQTVTATTATTGTEAKEIKKKSPYVYSFGDQWPGVKIGHRECNPPRFRIPQKMGWMWKLQQPFFGCKMRRGWRPGCIEKAVAAIIRAHREAKGLGLLNIPDFGQGKKRGGAGTETSSCHVRPKPTLHITKKDGVYNITMNPLKDPKTLAETEDPYMECTPMQFKITKNKLKVGDDDFCHCNDPPEDDSDDSELDIEFTPPAGIIHPERFKKKKNVIHIETQYNPADFAEKKKPSKKAPKKGDKKSKKGKEKTKKKSKYVDPGYC